jgi:FKBP-type peptidyl-prolyl cis-trans isomerase
MVGLTGNASRRASDDDGSVDDSDVEPDNEPISFWLNLAGWTEGVQLMVEGETRRLWIPERLASAGVRARRKGGPCSTSS